MEKNPKLILQKEKQRAIHQNLHKWTAYTRINVGMSTCEIAAGSKVVWETLHQEIKKYKISDVHIGQKGCVGRCHLEPTVEVFQQGKPPFKYENVDAKQAKKIVRDHLLKNKINHKREHTIISNDFLTDKSRYIFGDIDYFKKQKRIVLRNCGVIDPESLDDYLAVRGYEALAKVFTDYSSQQIIDEIKKSGLRGRGGGGFPTGTKWQFVADQKSDEKYVICNADEGDPGAFMDRSTIEGDPFSVIEAMTIGAYAVGANKGIIYIRAEYPLAVQRLKKAISAAKKLNLLGDNILGTKFSFNLDIVLGAGAFVCGEETALIHSIEGERGMPTSRPPYPSIKGLWQKPTLINNVETWANIPVIILDGYQAFAAIGTEKSKGTKVFALAGKIKNTGLVEVPMGTTLGEIIFDIGGGIKNNKKFKTAQTGGPSGGCLPAQFLNTPVDYESLIAAGSIMGSGGLIVMDETDCMVDVARFFLEFTQDESCGKCVPCREGTKRMLEILNRIIAGKGELADIVTLKELGETIKKTALCGLGQTAPNPALSTLKYFPEEYYSHIQERKCPAIVCAELFTAPCQHACPVHIDIPGYLGLIRNNKIKESLELILERNILPASCGRICHHPCEMNCRRQKLDQAVAIKKLKRFSTDNAEKYKLKLELKNSHAKKMEKVAIIGAGPAGLNCAYHLTSLGYGVTIFEAEHLAGGMLSLGIPEYRLPQKNIDSDIQRIIDTGVKIQTNKRLGQNISLSDLKKQNFKAIFIAIGSWMEKMITIPGINNPAVFGSLSFLKSCKTGKIKKIKGKYQLGKINFTGSKVAVIGGGNAAIDSARTALRLGAAAVNIIYRRTEDSLPAFPEEICDAKKEGVVINCLLNPIAIKEKNNKIVGIECAKMEQKEFDLTCRRKTSETSERINIDADIVIMAIGSTPELKGIKQDNINLEITKENTIKVDPDTLQTSVNGIFAGGDVCGRAGTVIDAMADGEKAAISIYRFLTNQDLRQNRFVINASRKDVPYIIPGNDIAYAVRPEDKTINIEAGRHCFNEVEFGYSKTEAIKEADRCLRCDRKEAED
jgi:NADH-quinone oxidoreductase subunit F